MHLQSELENYKLQVELLQEKLQRSEDNRQELEVKLEQIMKKRSEHETAIKSRSQRKYQQFLDEQKKRNERNHKLVEMLERIDQQAAALAARSERLKMMKLQYEFYFSKLAQSYSMKTLQNIPAVPYLPVQNITNPYTIKNPDQVVHGEEYLRSNQGPTPQCQTVPIPVVVPIANDQNRLTNRWALASDPPGVLISLTNNNNHTSANINGNKQNEANFNLDYLRFPIGYLQTTTGLVPIQQCINEPYLKYTPDLGIKTLKTQFEFDRESPSSLSLGDIKPNEALSNGTQSNQNQNPHSFPSEKTMRCEALDPNEKRVDEMNSHEPVKLRNFRVPNMSDNDSLIPLQSLKADILSNISQNNSLQRGTENGRIEHRGNKSNVIDFRTDGDDYIKCIKEMKETYEKNVPIPINSPPQEQSIDNITTTLQVQKIDETTVKDDEKINDIEDNEKNTSSAFPSLGGKCSMESIGDEALTKKSLENKTTENTSNAAARNIDPSRDTEQITLFNGTKNSRDESIGASNRTTAIIDGGGENVDNSEDTPLETNYRPMHFDKKEKMSIESIETAIYGELLPKPEILAATSPLDKPPIRDIRKEDNINYANEYNQNEYDTNNSQAPIFEPKTDQFAEPEENNYRRPTGSNEDASIKEKNTEQNIYINDNDNKFQEMQEVDTQDYNYGVGNEEEIPQQNYAYTEEPQVPQSESYQNDYQNYDSNQYQSNYDDNTYQYDYDPQYDDSNQTQYATEVYNQDYSQEPYAQEYTNYEQSASSDMDAPNQPYVEQQTIAEDQSEQPLSDEIEKPIVLEQELEETKPELEISKQYTTNLNEPNEESFAKKSSTPTSILSTEKHTDLSIKKKKRVNFVDSETDESSTLPKAEVGSSESDFDFSEK